MSALRYLPRTVGRWIGAIVTLGIVFVVAAFLIAWSGLYDVSVTAGHVTGVERFLKFARIASVEQHGEEAPEPPETLGDLASLQRAAGHFAGNCAFCHGAPGIDQSATVKHMSPMPPYITEDIIGRYDDKELFWIVANGYKFSGMPKWPAPGRPDEVWDMIGFLRQLPDLEPERFRELAYGPVAQQQPVQVTAAQGDAAKMGAQPAAMQAGAEGQGQSDGGESDGGESDGGQGQSRSGSGGMPAGGGQPALAISRAQGHIDIGLVQACSRCHGMDGRGRDTGAFPILGLQNEAYLKASLQAYSAGDRHSGYMRAVSTQLSQEQMGALAKYYSEQPTEKRTEVEASQELLDRGEKIAMEGLILTEEQRQAMKMPRPLLEASGEKLPACTSCHANNPGRDLPLVPRLSGQYKEYLVRQLNTWKFRDRGEGTREGNAMAQVAHWLPAEDIDAVASYWASRDEPVDYSTRPVEQNAEGEENQAQDGMQR
jgi:cytochrome c553